MARTTGMQNVKVEFNSNQVTIKELMSYLFEMIDPYSLNKQGQDVGENIVPVYIVTILIT